MHANFCGPTDIQGRNILFREGGFRQLSRSRKPSRKIGLAILWVTANLFLFLAARIRVRFPSVLRVLCVFSVNVLIVHPPVRVGAPAVPSRADAWLCSC